MSDFFQWDPSLLSVGVKEMDDEHMELIVKMNILYAANSKSSSKDEIKTLFSDFIKCAIIHFRNEEDYMSKINYSGLENHKIIHEKLMDKVMNYRDDFLKSEKLTDDFFNFLAVWLRSHIRGNDRLYA